MAHQFATRVKFEQMREELLGPAPSPLERLAVERILMTWFQVNSLEFVLAVLESTLTPQRIEQIERRRERANRSHLQAIKALAVLRRLEPDKPRPPCR